MRCERLSARITSENVFDLGVRIVLICSELTSQFLSVFEGDQIENIRVIDF